MPPVWWMRPYTWYLWYCSGQTAVRGDTPEGTFLLHHAVLTDFSYLSHHLLDKWLLISDLYPWSFGTPNGEENPDLPESENNPGQTIQVDSEKGNFVTFARPFFLYLFLTSSWESSKNVKPQCPRAFECTTVPVKLAFLLLRELLSWVSQQIYQEQDSADEQTELQSTLNGGLWWNRKSLHIQL